MRTLSLSRFALREKSRYSLLKNRGFVLNANALIVCILSLLFLSRFDDLRQVLGELNGLRLRPFEQLWLLQLLRASSEQGAPIKMGAESLDTVRLPIPSYEANGPDVPKLESTGFKDVFGRSPLFLVGEFIEDTHYCADLVLSGGSLGSFELFLCLVSLSSRPVSVNEKESYRGNNDVGFVEPQLFQKSV